MPAGLWRFDELAEEYRRRARQCGGSAHRESGSPFITRLKSSPAIEVSIYCRLMEHHIAR